MRPRSRIFCRKHADIKTFLAAGLVLNMILAFPANTATYYVAPAPSGNDGNDGNNWLSPFATINHALNQGGVTEVLVSNGTYVLTAQITVSDPVTIRSWNNGSTDRDGTVIDGNGLYRCFYLNNADAVLDSLTISNGAVLGSTSGAGGGLRITASGGTATNCRIVDNFVEARTLGSGGGGVHMRNGSLWNCIITGNTVTNTPVEGSYRESGGGILIHVTGMVANCQIYDNYAYNPNAQVGGGGISIISGNGARVQDSTISNNYSRGWGGGGVYLRAGTELNPKELIRCVIVGNETTGRGGGVCAYEIDVLAEDCIISNNTAGVYGGGAVLYGSTNSVLHGCTVVDNTAETAAGGLYIHTGGTIENCDFFRNESITSSGGGIFAYATGSDTIFIRHTAINSNKAGSSAGGIMMRNTWLKNSTVSNNTANQQGGGVYMSGSTNNIIRNSPVAMNTAGNYGGGLYIQNGGTIEDCEIFGNETTSAGGGIYASSSGNDMIFINRVVIHTNKAGTSAGGIWMAGSTWLEHSTVSDNNANSASAGTGGGIRMDGNNNTVINCRITGNHTAYRGGGVSIRDEGYLYSSLISGNTAADRFGGGIFAFNNHLGVISCCTVVDNEVQGILGAQRGAGICLVNTNHIYNCIVWSNRWSGTADIKERDLGLYPWTGGYSSDPVAMSNSVHYTCSPRDFNNIRGNITNHPMFVDFTNNNYRLQAGSPCINAGTNQAWMNNTLDLDGYPRPDRFTRQVDMGCYERVSRGMMFRSW